MLHLSNAGLTTSSEMNCECVGAGFGDQTLLIHSSICSSSIQALTCVLQMAPDGIFTFFNGHFVFPLKQLKVAIVFLLLYYTRLHFSEPDVQTRTVFFPFQSRTLFGTKSKKTGVSSMLHIYLSG